MDLRKRICVVGPSLKMGGMERASSVIANYFSKEGFHVFYLAIFKHEKFFKLDEKIIFDEPESFTPTLNIFKTVLRIRKKVKIFKPNTILVYNNFYAALTLLACINTKYPIYISDRASPFFKWKKSLKKFFLTIFKLIPPAGVISQTTIASEHQKKNFSKNVKFAVIPNALKEIKSYKNLEAKNYILAVGRLNDFIKGFDRLVKAWSLVKADDWKLVFAGGDGNANELKMLAKDAGIENKTIFLGKVIDIDKVYSTSKIFVIPSRSEGFPNALCEAMAHGLACISFDFTAGPRDIITPDVDGVIITNGDIDSLAAAIEDLINNENKRKFLGNNAMKIKDKLGVENIGKQFLKFILPENT